MNFKRSGYFFFFNYFHSLAASQPPAAVLLVVLTLPVPLQPAFSLPPPLLTPLCFLIFSLKGSCRSNLLFPETGVKGWGITALPPQCYKSRATEGEGREGGRGTGDARLASVRECRKAGYHGALWLGDFTAAPCEGGGGVENAHRWRGKEKQHSKKAAARQRGCPLISW